MCRLAFGQSLNDRHSEYESSRSLQGDLNMNRHLTMDSTWFCMDHSFCGRTPPGGVSGQGAAHPCCMTNARSLRCTLFDTAIHTLGIKKESPAPLLPPVGSIVCFVAITFQLFVFELGLRLTVCCLARTPSPCESGLGRHVRPTWCASVSL